jgi:DNA-binding FadR family transcriptional regulator
MKSNSSLSSDFLNYLVASPTQNGSVVSESLTIPSLTELSKLLGVSVTSLREQLEVAEALGLVEVRPHTGIRRLPYSFFPAVNQSLSYAIHLDNAYFIAFAELRNQVEASFWRQAVERLADEDHQALRALISQAMDKLHGSPVQIPHYEHRQLHLLIYKRLDNPFVHGLLEAYWEAYEQIGLNVYTDIKYLQEVWDYHQAMVEAICCGDFAGGYQLLLDHNDLLYQRS